jgi:cytochrome c553
MNTLERALSVAAVAIAASAPLLAQAGDVKAGERNAAMCIGCHGIHGYQSSFPEVHRVPMIAGQNAKYIVAALQAYKKGDRKHPTMKGIAQSLTDTEMANLAAFYEQQAGVAPVAAQPSIQPSAKVAELLKKANCVSCHGENYSKAIDASYPKLAGQHADYLYVALKSYTVDNNGVRGRNNAIMGGMARQYTPAELRAMANYIGSLQGELRTVPQSRLR